MSIAKDLVNALNTRKGTKAYDTTAEIVRIEGDTAWVHIPGGVDETPVKMTINASEGQTVQVRVANGSAFLVGNETAPPTDDRVANVALETAEDSVSISNIAIYRADEAGKVANNYISADNTGMMVADMADGQQTPSEATGRNVFIDNDSVDIRDGQTVLASFGETVVLGEAGKTRQELDYHSLQLIDKVGNVYFYVSDLRDSSGYATVTETFTGNGSSKIFAPSMEIYSLVSATDSSNPSNTATANISYVQFASAPADGATVTITYKTDDPHIKAYTLGSRMPNSNIGPMSVAEGNMVTASGRYSHVGGERATASGDYSFSHGYATESNGHFSHSEGGNAIANGQYSHAQNHYTIAQGKSQTVIGEYNAPDTTSALIIGNGSGSSASNRSNALTVDWDGNVNLSGTLTLPLNKYKASGGGINCRNCDIINFGAFYGADVAETAGEGILFYRDGTYWDGIFAKNGELFFAPNYTSGDANTKDVVVAHSGNIDKVNCFEKGTYNFGTVGTGYTTGTSGTVYVFLDLHRLIPSGATLTLNSLTGVYIRGVNGLIINNQTVSSNVTIARQAGSGKLRLYFTGQTTNWKANSPVHFVGTVNFTIS